MAAEAHLHLRLILGIITPTHTKFPVAQIQYQTDRKHGYRIIPLSFALTSRYHTIPIYELFTDLAIISGLEIKRGHSFQEAEINIWNPIPCLSLVAPAPIFLTQL